MRELGCVHFCDGAMGFCDEPSYTAQPANELRRDSTGDRMRANRPIGKGFEI